MSPSGLPTAARSIDDILAGARRRLRRLDPHEAARAVAHVGAMLVDIRPAAQRAEEGEIPGALVIERNVLEWRLDPASKARLPLAAYDLRVIVVCSEGYTSSLAAASLLDLGIRHATDLVGGFRAWADTGLPTTSPGGRDSSQPSALGTLRSTGAEPGEYVGGPPTAGAATLERRPQSATQSS